MTGTALDDLLYTLIVLPLGFVAVATVLTLVELAIRWAVGDLPPPTPPITPTMRKGKPDEYRHPN